VLLKGPEQLTCNCGNIALISQLSRSSPSPSSSSPESSSSSSESSSSLLLSFSASLFSSASSSSSISSKSETRLSELGCSSGAGLQVEEKSVSEVRYSFVIPSGYEGGNLTFLNNMVAVFEYEVDELGNCFSKTWKWK
jgi:hypothetical protein